MQGRDLARRMGRTPFVPSMSQVRVSRVSESFRTNMVSFRVGGMLSEVIRVVLDRSGELLVRSDGFVYSLGVVN